MEHKQFSRAVRSCASAALLITSWLLSLTPPAFATDVLPLSLRETVRQADAIVLGTVTAKQSRWGDGTRRWMMTDYSMSVERVIYPSERSETINQTVTLSYWGGTINGETQAISDVRLPVIGERLVMMLRPDWRGTGFAPVVGLNKGLFLVSTAKDGTELILDSGGMPLALAPGGQVARRMDAALAQSPNVNLASFLGWVSTSIPGIKASPSEVPALKDSSLPPGNAKAPSFAPFVAPGGTTSPLMPSAAAAPAAAPFAPPVDNGSELGTAQALPVGRMNYSYSHQAHLPIVVNNFPASFAPWSPEDQYQMSKWNAYASDVFRVYTTPTGTFGWGNGVFDLDGWPSSATMLSVYGAGWDSNTIGVTWLRYDGGGWIVEADIALNPAFGFTLDDEWVYGGSSAQGFRQVMLHELGHMWGLNHNFNALSVMNYMPSAFRAFGIPYMDDAEAIRASYSSRAVAVTDLGVYLYYASGYQSVSDAFYPSSVTAGNSLTVSNFHIENVGTATVATPTIEWYLTAARNFSGSYVSLGTSTYNPLPRFTYFTPGSLSRTLTVPGSVTPGNYYLAAYIRNDAGAGQSGFPFSNNYAFSRYTIRVNAALFNLSVSKNGSGSGTVASSPGGISCGSTCSASYTQGTTVTLTAAAASGSTFAGWSGAGCSGTGTCVVSMTQARSVAATFNVIQYTLTVSKGGTGSGTVTSSPSGISCGATCSAAFNSSASVTLTAAAASGSTFAGWSGSGCSGTGTCVVSMTQARSVTASFQAAQSQFTFLGGFTGTTLRNNFSGFVGMKFTVGSGALGVGSLGRICIAGNSGIHTVKLVNASTGIDVPGGSLSLSMGGCTAGQFKYAPLPNPVPLSANTAYYLASQEAAGGDQWYDSASVSSSSAAAVNASAWSTGAGWNLYGAPNTSYVPVNFLYGGVSGPSDMTIRKSHSGNFTRGQNGATYTIIATNSGGAATSGTVSVSDTLPAGLTATGIAGTGWGCAQPVGPCTRNDALSPGASYPPLTLTVNVSASAPASVTNVANVSGGGEINTGNNSWSDLTTVVASAGNPFLTAFTSGTRRNNFSGFVGMKFTVGSGALSARSLGRICIAGNTGTHTIKLVNASNGIDVPGGSISLNMAGCTAGQFKYAPLPTPVALAANTAYYLASQETAGGDQWYEFGAVSSTSAAAVNNSVWSTGASWNLQGGANTSYVPVNFLY